MLGVVPLIAVVLTVMQQSTTLLSGILLGVVSNKYNSAKHYCAECHSAESCYVECLSTNYCSDHCHSSE
jgi:hypothetical protein